MSTTISASQVKELRELTGAAMMDCKKALEASGGNMQQAIEELRKSGSAKAAKKSSRTAAEGAITILEKNNQAVMIEINSETDFVARHDDFTAFGKAVAALALENKINDAASLSSTVFNGSKTVEEARLELVAKVGENVQIRRLVLSQAAGQTVGTYIHGNRIGVIVELDTDNKELAKDVAMHIAASRPLVIAPENVPEDVIAKEKEIYLAQSAASGKPQDIVEKMAAGRLKKYLDEVSLLGQPFVKDPDISVGSLLNKHRAKVLAFYRYEVGEGIEKVVEDFREAVMSQVQGG